MMKYFLSIFISILFLNQSLAKDVSINENINLEFVCDLEKKIVKNSEYNYQTFLGKDLNEKGLDKFKIQSKQPDTLLIGGLSLFLSDTEKLNVKVVITTLTFNFSVSERNNDNPPIKSVSGCFD